uniref:NADH-ubiquinone oxidoreductase chain 6 n=1 Tax=Trachinops taeniatus TaxID=1040957 RepID=I1T2H3_9TELE|nr:NADH dehydrogenase subunit 6 [Trachinops taeniatus]AEK53195.1 NADH dehydrogenase subunit 6 [Trachinops taeniatus]
MSFLLVIFLMGAFLGMVSVASNPSPYYAAFGLVMVAGMGCGVLAMSGGSFSSLVLFLVYLGGMLVVFAYSAAFCAEPYPEDWSSLPVLWNFLFYVALGGAGWGAVAWAFEGKVGEINWGTEGKAGEISQIHWETEGVGELYSVEGGGMIGLAVWMLLQTLFVVFELTRGLGRGPLR